MTTEPKPKTKPIPITLHQTATGYAARAITPGDPTPTLYAGSGDSPGEAINQALECIIITGNGHNRLWIKGNYTHDPAQDLLGVQIAEDLE